MHHRRLTAPALAFVFAAAAAARPAPVLAPTQDQVEVEVESGSALPRVVGRLLATQGGQERVEGLRGFDFQFTDVVIQYPDGAEGEPLEVPGPRMAVSLATDPADRAIRLVQQIDLGDGPQELVRVASAAGSGVRIGDEVRESEQLAVEARNIAVEMMLLHDLVWGLLNGQVTGTDDGVRTRDGIQYDTVQVRFSEGRGVADTFRLYLDRESGLVRRCDHFDGADLRRKATLLFQGYVEDRGIQAPTRIDFLDRDRRLSRYWLFEELVVDPEWGEGHFEVR